MVKKHLTAEQKELVGKAAADIVREAGKPVRDNELASKIYEQHPDLREHSLWTGIGKAGEDRLITRVKRKGWVVQDSAVGEKEEAEVRTPRSGRESEYYRPVAEWFTNQSNCLAKFKKGREWGMPDVSVVRGSSARYLDDLELITVEVKRGNATVSDLTQAYGYSKLAHRCYLAADVEDKLKSLKESAERIGIGLLLIDPQRPDRIQELLSPPRSEPSITSLQDHLARVFDLVLCALCGTYFQRKRSETRTLLRKRATATSSEVTKFICHDCYELFLHGKDMPVWRG